MSTLDEIIRMATFAGDTAMDDPYRTTAEMIAVAVDAAIRAAVDNGVLVVPADADAKLAAGFTVRFVDEDGADDAH